MNKLKKEELKVKDLGQILDLHNDLKKTMVIANEWLYRLSEEERKRFIRSEDFVTFKNTLKKINTEVQLEDVPPQKIQKESKEDFITKLRGVFKIWQELLVLFL